STSVSLTLVVAAPTPIADPSFGTVRDGDGVVQVSATDLSSDGFGTPWTQTRSWSNTPGYANTNINGVGWVDSQLPTLQQISGVNTLAVIGDSSDPEYFDLGAGDYSARFADLSTLTHDTTNKVYVLTDTSGNQTRFNDFTTNWPASEQGQFSSYTDP